MWVVKIGGSLNEDPRLPAWLDLFASLGGGRVILVCGGGAFADEVRRAQSRWCFDDLAAHNMAVLAMMQSAYLAKGLEPRLQTARDPAEAQRVLHASRAALWLPFDWLRDEPGPATNWDNSGDSIALDLALRLNAERLLLVKSCPIDAGAALADCAAAGIVDGRFLALAAEAAFPIELRQCTEIARVRSQLLCENRCAGG